MLLKHSRGPIKIVHEHDDRHVTLSPNETLRYNLVAFLRSTLCSVASFDETRNFTIFNALFNFRKLTHTTIQGFSSCDPSSQNLSFFEINIYTALRQHDLLMASHIFRMEVDRHTKVSHRQLSVCLELPLVG